MKKSKDPAFLFYTNDFQGGTIDMSCEEVGAYLRLLMYQHQHDKIPNNKERLMRITGIFSEEKFDVVWEVVGKKFNQTVDHLVNERLKQETTKRTEFKPKKIASASLAGLISKSDLTKKQVAEIKKAFTINDFVNYPIDEIKNMVREWFNQMVNRLVSNIENENVNENIDRDKEKGGTGGKTTRGKKSETKPPKIQFAEFVSMTNGEYEALVTKFGVEDTARMIEILDNYKGSSGKVYASDYRAILTWVVARLKEEKEKQGNNQHNGTAANKNGLEGTNRTDKSNPRRNYAEQCRTEQEVLKQVSLAVLQQS